MQCPGKPARHPREIASLRSLWHSSVGTRVARQTAPHGEVSAAPPRARLDHLLQDAGVRNCSVALCITERRSAAMRFAAP
jgi:hypothetical protein